LAVYRGKRKKMFLPALGRGGEGFFFSTPRGEKGFSSSFLREGYVSCFLKIIHFPAPRKGEGLYPLLGVFYLARGEEKSDVLFLTTFYWKRKWLLFFFFPFGWKKRESCTFLIV